MKKINFYLTIFSALILHGLSVSAQDVYVAGNQLERRPSPDPDIHIGTVWQNGNVLYTLGEGTTLTSIFVDGEDIYVGGEKGDPDVQTSAVVWKNNQAITLASVAVQNPLPSSPSGIGGGHCDAGVQSVIVYKGDVYALGCTYIQYSGLRIDDNVAKVWKNGEELYTIFDYSAQDASGGLEPYWVTSMAIYNGDIYVTGYYYDANDNTYTSLWKNGEPVDKSEEYKYALSVYVENGNVYVAGNADYYDANGAYLYQGSTLWTNGNKRLLDVYWYIDGDFWYESDAFSVYANNGKVYVGGYTSVSNTVTGDYVHTAAKIWTNYDEIIVNENDYISGVGTSVSAVCVLDKVYAAVNDAYENNTYWDLQHAYVWSNGELSDISVGDDSWGNAIFVTPAPQPTPGLPRQVTLKVSGAYESDVATGIYYVDSGDSFTFTVKPKTDGDEPVVTTSRKSSAVDKDYVVKPVGDGAYEITVYGINSPTTITVESSSPSAVAGIAALKVYASGNAIFIDAPTAGTAQIYAESGALVKTVSYGAGQTTVALTKGIYVVKTGNTVAKVVIN